MELSKKIHELRKIAGLTQEQLAEKTDVTRQTVSKWESGISTPDWESMIKISKLFNFTLDEFAESNEDMVQKDCKKMNMEDLMQLNDHKRRMLLFLIGGITFLMICIMALIIIFVAKSSTLSIQYTLYRYIALGEYTFLPANYLYSDIFAVISGIIGTVLLLLYFYFRNFDKDKKGCSG